MSGLDVVTFGCRLNAYESEVIRARAREAGLTAAVIVNTCAVTAEAERQARQAIRKARRARPEARIIVTGCAAQIDPQRYAAMAEVDQVLGNGAKLRPRVLLERGKNSGRRHPDAARDGRAPLGRLCRARAGLRPGAAGLRPSLYVLHHSLRPRAESQHAPWPHRRGGAQSRRARRQ